jgi:uncharacterized damage-inducible protein DinB
MPRTQPSRDLGIVLEELPKRAAECITLLDRMHDYFHRTVRCLKEEDWSYRPNDKSFSAAQHIMHAAGGIENVLNCLGEFEKWNRPDPEATSIAIALREFDRSVNEAIRMYAELTDEEIMTPFSKKPPYSSKLNRYDLLIIALDHTAQHRGAVNAFAILCGRTPRVPYFDSEEVDWG